jgi:tetratricopeptide (TPR) repeat protein
MDGTLERSLVIVVADHGEGLGEHDEPTHGAFCYDSTARVPLLLRFPHGRRTGRSDAPVSVVDVFPTALEALGLPVPAGTDAVSLWDEDPGADRGVYLESYSGWLNYGWSPLAGWFQGGLKYLHSSAPELYRVETDPGESEDRYDPRTPFVDTARQALAAVWARPRLEITEQASFSPELLSELRQLGYGASGAPVHDLPPPLEKSERPAPRERARELLLLLQATALGEGRRHAEAVEMLRMLLAENPHNCLALEILGFHLMQLKAFEEALEALQRRLACGSERADTWLNIGICRERLGDLEQGIEALRHARTIDPGHAQVRDELARMLAEAGRDQEAAELLREFVR